jgi:hypothetical protein
MTDSKLALPAISPSSSLFQIRDWIDAVEIAARNSAPNGLVYGMLALVNPQLYAALPNAPAWVLEDRIPGPYPAGAAAGVEALRKAWSANKIVCDANDAARQALTVVIWASIDPAMVQVLRHPAHGFHAVTIDAVVAHIRTRYGQITPTFFNELKEYLRNPMRPEVSLEAVLAEHNQVFILSASIQQPLSESDRVRFLQRAVANIPDYAHAVQTYVHSHGDIATQTFDGLQAQLLIAARNTSSTSAGHLGLSAMAPAAAPAAFGASTATTNTSTGEKTNSGRGPRAPAAATAAGGTPPPKRVLPTHLYCWYHGDCGHVSADCHRKSDPGFDLNATKANPGTGAVGPWSQVRLRKN